MTQRKFIVIQEWMLELGLKGSELLTYAIIYGFCQDDQSDFHGSTAYIARWCGISRQQAVAVLKKLTEAGHLIKTGELGYPAHYRTSFSEGGVKFPPPYENLTGGVKLFDKGCQETGHNNKDINIDINKDSHSITRTREEIAYGDKVRMTAEEHDKLVKQYGEEDAAALCEILDDYMCATGATYKSHYRAIKKWCVDKLTERKAAQLRLKNAQQPRTPAAPAAPAGNYAGLAEARARLKAIQDKYKN